MVANSGNSLDVGNQCIYLFSLLHQHPLLEFQLLLHQLHLEAKLSILLQQNAFDFCLFLPQQCFRLAHPVLLRLQQFQFVPLYFRIGFSQLPLQSLHLLPLHLQPRVPLPHPFNQSLLIHQLSLQQSHHFDQLVALSLQPHQLPPLLLHQHLLSCPVVLDSRQQIGVVLFQGAYLLQVQLVECGHFLEFFRERGGFGRRGQRSLLALGVGAFVGGILAVVGEGSVGLEGESLLLHENSILLLKMSRVRQFSDLRASSRSIQRQPSTRSHYACVNCVNKSLSQQKQQLNASRLQLEETRKVELEQSRMAHTQLLNEAKQRKAELEKAKLVAYHQQQRQLIEERKQREAEQRERERAMVEQAKQQHQRKVQQDRRKEQQQREKWRYEIEQQMQQKQENKLRQQLQDRQTTIEQPTPLPNPTLKAELYRTQLLAQIKEQQDRKHLQQLTDQNYHSQELTLVQQSEERAQVLRQQEDQRKRQLLEDARERDRQAQQRKAEKLLLKQQERAEMLIQQQLQEKRRQEEAERKEMRANSYLTGIKRQAEQQAQRKKEEELMNRTAVNSSFLEERQLECRTCDSCEKNFPKTYLTRID